MNLLDLLPELLTAICNLDPIACQRLWIYLPDCGEIRPDGWAEQFTEVSSVNRGDFTETTTKLFWMIHSVNDLPAITCGQHKVWYHRGDIHRDGGPALQFCESELNELAIYMNPSTFEYDLADSSTIRIWLQHGELAANSDGHVIRHRGLRYDFEPGMIFTNTYSNMMRAPSIGVSRSGVLIYD